MVKSHKMAVAASIGRTLKLLRNMQNDHQPSGHPVLSNKSIHLFKWTIWTFDRQRILNVSPLSLTSNLTLT